MDFVELDLTVKDLDEVNIVENGDKIAAFYSGALGTNGTLFDHSFINPGNKDPLYISLSADEQWDLLNVTQYTPVIPGFKQGIIGMVPGETHVIVVPPELGYETGKGPEHLIGITLLFEVQLISNDRNV
jgi:FKBP-type peptidyl-prolyl cis-trans isomerase